MAGVHFDFCINRIQYTHTQTHFDNIRKRNGFNACRFQMQNEMTTNKSYSHRMQLISVKFGQNLVNKCRSYCSVNGFEELRDNGNEREGREDGIK